MGPLSPFAHRPGSRSSGHDTPRASRGNRRSVGVWPLQMALTQARRGEYHNPEVPKMRPRVSAIRAVVLILTTALSASTIVWSTAGRATAASALPSLSVTQLTPPIPTSASVTVIALDNTNRTLVNVDDGATNGAYLGSGSSWQRVAQFRPVTFSTVGSLLLHKDAVVGNRGS